ncbi:MAG: hypothetical protein KF819_26075 [Labilithrix sp.]|nr:hypothetical protein [Labilithrix sp.]
MKGRAREGTSKSRRPPVRDMDASAFAVILGELISRLPGAYACSLVDGSGETVDYAGLGDPFDVKVAAAHARILLNQVEELGALGAPRWIVIRGAARSIIARKLPEGYAIVVLLRRRAGFTASERAFATCAAALAREAGWPLEAPERGGEAAWIPVDVEIDQRGRPAFIGAPPVRVEVLGSVMGLPRRERGYRVRTAAGTELTVVREAGNCWYADDRHDAYDALR